MNIAITDRFGPDDSPLTLAMERSNEIASAILGHPVPPSLPVIGTQVCAIGLQGWRYIGQVVEVNEQAMTYTIKPIATTNRFATRPPDRQPDRRPRI